MLLIEDIWKLSYDMNIYECRHVSIEKQIELLIVWQKKELVFGFKNLVV